MTLRSMDSGPQSMSMTRTARSVLFWYQTRRGSALCGSQAWLLLARQLLIRVYRPEVLYRLHPFQDRMDDLRRQRERGEISKNKYKEQLKLLEKQANRASGWM